MSTTTFRILMMAIAITGFNAGFEFIYLLIIK